jgi:hypothetical protein
MGQGYHARGPQGKGGLRRGSGIRGRFPQPMRETKWYMAFHVVYFIYGAKTHFALLVKKKLFKFFGNFFCKSSFKKP